MNNMYGKPIGTRLPLLDGTTGIKAHKILGKVAVGVVRSTENFQGTHL